MNEVNTVRVSNITLLETKSSPCGYRYEVIVRAIAINAESKKGRPYLSERPPHPPNGRSNH